MNEMDISCEHLKSYLDDNMTPDPNRKLINLSSKVQNKIIRMEYTIYLVNVFIYTEYTIQ